MPKICVKWSGQKYDVDVNTDLEPLVLKSQLFELTGVIPDRQKVMIKGKILKDESWGDIKLKEGELIMMMGSSDALPQRINMDQSDGAAGQMDGEEEKVVLPAGLKNLGNSCYMNASLQCYKAIPELSDALKIYSAPPNEADARGNMLTTSVKKLFEDMDRAQLKNPDQQVSVPFLMLTVLHNVFPQFATRNERGEFQQQDANECFAETLRMISEQTRLKSAGSPTETQTVRTSRLFETEFEVTLKNLENPDEPVDATRESTMQLSCFLSQEVKYVQLGIKSKLTEEIEKHSASLGRNAKYQKQSLVRRLPAYLSIQMVRFFYKEKDQINAKILKDVKFPINLDLQDICTPELKTKIQPMRDLFKAYDEKVQEELKQAKMDVDSGKSLPKKAEPTDFEPYSFQDDPGSNNSGLYELKGVITHKGRASNSGHYVAWVRVKGDKWAMCDDDEVHPVSEEDVLKLSGGGDWHCAYVLLYGPRALPKQSA
ncbi:ubiquitin carboxyl-terminal hydrolase domain-containing protein [Ditylenchus destructor]|uniref:Ubiquitin carboxyl-terminal hydrolase n=1 Tax=Ditylenchus destructor TaxID=166010 RepID=A0AAD4MJY5_9BILA|nr:ubiquitin carboxyl-terminal hydrolase domain-containing protein [Ditylenchus destructor]